MIRSNTHLAEALEEYNAKVHECEEKGTEEQRLNAYIMRGTILSMMESYISALTDFDDAVEIISSIESKGTRVDPGSFIKAHVSRGELQYADGAVGMADDYAVAAERLTELNENSRYFDRKKIIKMCIECCEDLLDEGYPNNVRPFFEKVEMMLFDKIDPWSENRYVEALNFMGQAEQDLNEFGNSLEYLDKSVKICQELMKKDALEDEMAFVFALMLRGDVGVFNEDFESGLRDFEAAISVLEVMLAYHRPETKELLIQTHRDVSDLLIKMGEDSEAEKHMLRMLELDVSDGLNEFDDV